MKLLHVVPTYLPATRYGGPIRSVHGLCCAMARLGHEVHVFTTNVDGDGISDVNLDAAIDLDGVKVWYFPVSAFRRLYHSPAMSRALDTHIKKFDVVHLHSVFLWPTWAAAGTARRASIPYVLSPRGMLESELIKRKGTWRKLAWIQMIERNNLVHAAAIHVTSQREHDELSSLNLALAPLINIPNGVDLAASVKTSQYSLLDELPESFILYIGRINWKKGLDRLIRAMTELPDVHLVIAGNDEEHYQEQLVKQANDLETDQQIHFIGAVSDDEKWSLYQHARLCVLPSYSENFGIVVLEAMAVGCPIFVTPEVGAGEFVRESGAGRVVPPEKLGVEIKKALDDPAALKEYGNNGQKWVQSYMTWDKVSLQMSQAYKDILESVKA